MGMVMRISGDFRTRATHTALLVLIGAACGGSSAATAGPAVPARRQPLRIVPRDSVFVLEAWGASPNDTSLTLAARRGRVVILRHGPPDNTVFAQLSIPPDLGSQSDRDSVRLSVTPRPGLYGVDIEASRPLPEGVTLTFKYPVHFSPPVAMGDRYRSRVAFERALVIGHVRDDRRIALLPSTQPASDNLEADIPGAGRYLVVAPR